MGQIIQKLQCWLAELLLLLMLSQITVCQHSCCSSVIFKWKREGTVLEKPIKWGIVQKRTQLQPQKQTPISQRFFLNSSMVKLIFRIKKKKNAVFMQWTAVTNCNHTSHYSTGWRWEKSRTPTALLQRGNAHHTLYFNSDYFRLLRNARVSYGRSE